MKKILDYKKFTNKFNESLSNDNELINKIDYTLLKPEATENDIIELCQKADTLGVKSVCVLPKMVKIAAESLRDSDVLVCTVVSFPHGTDTTDQKLTETKECILDGADEVDMVLNYPLLKKSDKYGDNVKYETNYNIILDDVRWLVEICHNNTNKTGEPITLKVIVESGLLSDEETEESTYICLQAGADFIKTSTGMVSIGAELNKVQIMRNIINQEGSNMKIKASGGLRTLEDLKKFNAYVDRFGVGYAAVDSIFGTGEKTNDSY